MNTQAEIKTHSPKGHLIIEPYSLPSKQVFGDCNKVFIIQANYNHRKRIVNYTSDKTEGLTGCDTIAIFRVKPKQITSK